MKNVFLNRVILAVCGFMPLCASLHAAAVPDEKVSLSATAVQEVPQDWLTFRLTTSRDGTDAATVQQQLKSALESALQVAKPQAQTDALQLRTGNMGLYPRYGREGKINGWQGSVELVIEGKDFVRISQVAAQVNTLVVQSMAFDLSAGARRSLELQLQDQALGLFKQKAQSVAHALGYQSYALDQMNVGSVDGWSGPVVRPMMMQARVLAVADSAPPPMPAEAGRSTVQLQVNGTIVLK
jgi:predicted secreted protein